MIFAFLILMVYGLMLFWLTFGFLKTKTFYDFQNNQHQPVCIIICARDEEKYVARCISSIASQDYPHNLIELIFVDDGSKDNTLNIAHSLMSKFKLNYQIIKNPNPLGKKISIANAIKSAKAEFIITRDADTYTLSDLWLSSLVVFQIQTKSDFIIAPVALADNDGILWALQTIENNTLSVFTMGSAFFKKPFLCNGANLAFTKEIFYQCNGYQSHLHIASGDDVLFLEDVKKITGSKINYLKSERAIVYTYPNFSLKSLLQQKVRWASKFKVNDNKLNLLLAILGFVVNLIWLFCFVYGFVMPQTAMGTLFFILIKFLIDFLVLLVASTFIRNRNILWYVLPVAFVYPIYACIVAVASIVIKPNWKN